MQFDLKKIEITNPIGEPLIIPDLHEQIGNTLFYAPKNNLAIFELAKKISQNKPFEITKNEIDELIKYLQEWELALHVKIPFLNYLKHLQNEFTKS